MKQAVKAIIFLGMSVTVLFSVSSQDELTHEEIGFVGSYFVTMLTDDPIELGTTVFLRDRSYESYWYGEDEPIEGSWHVNGQHGILVMTDEDGTSDYRFTFHTEGSITLSILNYTDSFGVPIHVVGTPNLLLEPGK